jgi:hypothetical protein
MVARINSLTCQSVMNCSATKTNLIQTGSDRM